MKIIVGLGNYESRYEHTYHNIGFDVVSKIADNLGVSFTKKMCEGLVAEARLDGEKLLLVKPLTLMNLSGNCLRALKKKFRDARILVVVDDIDLPRGTVRYRRSGSAGTHNGLRSIVSQIGEDFERLKVGIGRDISVPLVDYVLSKYDNDTFAPIIERASADAIERISTPLN